MKTVVSLQGSSRPSVETRLFECMFKDYLDEACPPEILYKLQQAFISASSPRQKSLTEYSRLFNNALGYVTNGLKEKEFHGWKMNIEIY